MITIRTDELELARLAAGLHASITDLARAMGVERSVVSKTLAGKLAVSADFIAGARRAFPHIPFERLFSVDAEQVSA